MNATAPIERWFLARLPEAAGGWFRSGLSGAAQSGPEVESFAAAWNGCGRRLGRASLDIAPEEVARLRQEGAPFLPVGWGADEIGRGLLLVAALNGRPGELAARVAEELFRGGEMREQQAVLRVLALLPEPQRQRELAAEAVRSNVLSVLEALACDNPFPAAHMPELAFNQMIMKAIFNGLPLHRVVGLAERNNPELQRMVSGFVSEREAAGRTVPSDLHLILAARA